MGVCMQVAAGESACTARHIMLSLDLQLHLDVLVELDRGAWTLSLHAGRWRETRKKVETTNDARTENAASATSFVRCFMFVAILRNLATPTCCFYLFTP